MEVILLLSTGIVIWGFSVYTSVTQRFSKILGCIIVVLIIATGSSLYYGSFYNEITTAKYQNELKIGVIRFEFDKPVVVKTVTHIYPKWSVRENSIQSINVYTETPNKIEVVESNHKNTEVF